MIKKILHIGVSVLLACVVLFSTLSFTIEKHYCGTYLVDTAIFTTAKKCGMEMANITDTVKKSCCKDEIDLVKGQDELKLTAFEQLDFETQTFFCAFVYTLAMPWQALPKQIIPHKNYSPPDLIVDIQVLDDCFLI